jgi:hypothetical protein
MVKIDTVVELNDVIAEMLRLGQRMYDDQATPQDHIRLQALNMRYLELQPQVEAQQ